MTLKGGGQGRDDAQVHAEQLGSVSMQCVHVQESGQRLTLEEVDRAEMMHKYTLNNAHYFCETADITRPFPSGHVVSDPSWEFVWNRWLAVSLRSQNLADLCPQLLQV